MRKRTFWRASKRTLWFLALTAIVYVSVFAVALVILRPWRPVSEQYSPEIAPAPVVLDVLLVAVMLSGVVVAGRVGHAKAAILASGLVVGWLLALGISGPVAGIVMPHVPSQPLVTMALYGAFIVLGAMVALCLFRRADFSESRVLARLVAVRGTRWGVGIALGIIVAGIVVVALARTSFDVSTVDRSSRVALLDAIANSFIAPAYVRATRQLTGPWVTSRSFDIAIDGVDSNIFVDSAIVWHARGCTLLDEEGQALGFGSGELCKDATANALGWQPYPLIRWYGPEILISAACGPPNERTYYGERWPSDWCAWYENDYECVVEGDYLMSTSNEQTCTLIRRAALEDDWPPPVESLPLPR